MAFEQSFASKSKEVRDSLVEALKAQGCIEISPYTSTTGVYCVTWEDSSISSSDTDVRR